MKNQNIKIGDKFIFYYEDRNLACGSGLVISFDSQVINYFSEGENKIMRACYCDQCKSTFCKI